MLHKLIVFISSYDDCLFLGKSENNCHVKVSGVNVLYYGRCETNPWNDVLGKV